MADNVGYTPGSGATVAADDIGGILYQRVKPVTGDDGTATDVSATNPMPVAAYGELMEAIESLRMAISSFSRTVSTFYPDHRSALVTRVLEGTLTTVGTVSVVSVVSAVNSVAGLSALGNRNPTELVDSSAGMLAAQLRNNIVVS